uniref:Putative secreted protein n=1 Tax=Anopheles darlingi TaxID=43151 RepID=A0A2M4DLW4_ANODA
MTVVAVVVVLLGCDTVSKSVTVLLLATEANVFANGGTIGMNGICRLAFVLSTPVVVPVPAPPALGGERGTEN